jgi:hypothetical protein
VNESCHWYSVPPQQVPGQCLRLRAYLVNHSERLVTTGSWRHRHRTAIHHAGSSSRSNIHREVPSIARHHHRAAFFIARDSHRVVFSLRSILIARYSHHATFSSSALSIARHSYRAVFFIARHRHRTVTCEKCVAHKCNAGALCKSSNACRTECQPKKVIYSELCCFLLDSRIHSLHIRPPACRYRHLC